MYFGALEAGGTKMVVGIGDENGRILDRQSFPTLTPDETMPLIADYFKGRDIQALGIACFGPIDLIPDSPTYGHITSTPKLAWRDTDIVGYFKQALGVPIGFDTDVNGSLLGEVTWGCAKGLTDAVYITIGTGIGAGIMSGGKLLHGMLHAELGHMLMDREINDIYTGGCPYHGCCFEGLASGPAIEARYGRPAAELTDEKDVWELESTYIARALVNTIMILSPQRIILGGGVMHQGQLFPLIRRKVTAYLGGYIRTRELEDMDSYIVPASLNDDQGIMGAVKLAIDEYRARNQIIQPTAEAAVMSAGAADRKGDNMAKDELDRTMKDDRDGANDAGHDNSISDEKKYVARKRWLFLGLPFTFTKYTVGEDLLTIDSGFFKKKENDCYMYKIQDVQFSASLMERIVGLGTITCFTGDVTDPKLELIHIKHAKEIKDYIIRASERARIRRRTLNTLNIGAVPEELDPADFM